MCIDNNLVDSHSNDQKLLVHELIMQETSYLLEATRTDEHFHGIRAAEVHIRFQGLVKVFDGIVRLKHGSRPIIYEVYLCRVNKVIVKLNLISEEWFEVRPIHQLALSLIYFLEHLAFTHCCDKLLSEP